ncbi:hypothetical protein AAFF_G00246900 [Aldrovandia affinis]|uniref:Uncharacterized protein n=1 Tax=Aldrovandia affinis TaxID=143900 RepID=A0AAD7SU54_9TELE|nr:hypothetical protein AAFF_G00246900 [Aldrovandia affinis]
MATPQWPGLDPSSVHTELNGAATYRFPTGLVGVTAGGLSGAVAAVEGIVSGALPMAHGIAPVSRPPHTPSPGQPSKAETDRDIPSDQ